MLGRKYETSENESSLFFNLLPISQVLTLTMNLSICDYLVSVRKQGFFTGSGILSTGISYVDAIDSRLKNAGMTKSDRHYLGSCIGKEIPLDTYESVIPIKKTNTIVKIQH
jgi:hypothetical protein